MFYQIEANLGTTPYEKGNISNEISVQGCLFMIQAVEPELASKAARLAI